MDMPDTFNPSALLGTRDDGKLDSLKMMALQRSGKKSEREMRDIAGQFQTMMVRLLLKEMRKSVPESGLMENNGASEMYSDIADDYLAQEMSKSSGMGINDIIYRELKDKNDKLVKPSEAKKQFKSIDLNPDSTGTETQPFLPLQPDTNRFLDFHNSSKMMELPKKEGEFKELQKQRRIGSDKIVSF